MTEGVARAATSDKLGVLARTTTPGSRNSSPERTHWTILRHSSRTPPHVTRGRSFLPSDSWPAATSPRDRRRMEAAHGSMNRRRSEVDSRSVQLWSVDQVSPLEFDLCSSTAISCRRTQIRPLPAREHNTLRMRTRRPVPSFVAERCTPGISISHLLLGAPRSFRW